MPKNVRNYNLDSGWMDPAGNGAVGWLTPKAVSPRPPGQVRRAVQVQIRHDAIALGPDGVHTHGQGLSDLVVAVPVGEIRHETLLLRGEPFGKGFRRDSKGAIGYLQIRGQKTSSGENTANGVTQELVHPVGLAHQAMRPQLVEGVEHDGVMAGV